tara:strand:- start:578 stop:832 length:255 start_codon:yes stop_codon:yes gene_type:complete
MESQQCLSCKHYLGGFDDGIYCNAFPVDKKSPIPYEIFSGQFDHRSKHPKDNGILWEKSEDYIDDPDDNDSIIDMSNQPPLMSK